MIVIANDVQPSWSEARGFTSQWGRAFFRPLQLKEQSGGFSSSPEQFLESPLQDKVMDSSFSSEGDSQRTRN
ncbi:hypothetical protein LXL04_031312 [Taraxacum kok-saghyz]